jgi:hypothetical protein
MIHLSFITPTTNLNMYEHKSKRKNNLTVEKIVNTLWDDCKLQSPKISRKKSPNCNVLDDFFSGNDTQSFGGSTSSNSNSSSGYYIPQGTFNGMGTDNIIINSDGY